MPDRGFIGKLGLGGIRPASEDKRRRPLLSSGGDWFSFSSRGELPQPSQRTRKDGPPTPASRYLSKGTRYRDPSLGAARLRVRLRCLRMTINSCRSLDSGARNNFLGESSGPYIWGKEKNTPGISGVKGSWSGGRLGPCGA